MPEVLQNEPFDDDRGEQGLVKSQNRHLGAIL
jgi:hypothetical protein